MESKFKEGVLIGICIMLIVIALGYIAVKSADSYYEKGYNQRSIDLANKGEFPYFINKSISNETSSANVQLACLEFACSPNFADNYVTICGSSG